TVTDNGGSVGQAQAVVTVNNVAPTAHAWPSQTVSEGTPVTLTGSYDDPGVLDTQTLRWHVASSNSQTVADGTGGSFTFTPVDNGTYTVTLTVTDKDGGVGQDDVVVTVNNVAPTALPGSDRTVGEGSLVSLTGGFTDPGSLDTQTFLWHAVSSNGQVIADG